MLRKLVSIAALACIIAPAHASDSVADAIKQCAQTTNSLQRLVCFDRIASRIQDYSDDVLPAQRVAQSAVSVPRPAVSASANPSTNTASPADKADLPFTPNNQVDDFGRVELANDTLSATVTAVTTDRNDYFTITINNGQKWRQTEVSRLNIEVGDRIEIEEGLFGSFILTSESSNRTARVKRVQ